VRQEPDRDRAGPCYDSQLALAMMMEVIDVVWSILVIIHVESALERYQLRRDFSSQTVPWKLD
jgi:hypothetical protein